MLSMEESPDLSSVVVCLAIIPAMCHDISIGVMVACVADR